MKFYKAFESETKPFIRWMGWAKNIDELILMGEADNPLILPAELLPDYIYSVCPYKIVDGELVNRTEAEMAVFEAEFEERTSFITEANKINDINKATFNHAGNFYPMHEAARLRYFAIAGDAPGNQNFMTVTGAVITILEADLPTFLNKFYKEIQLITNVAP